MKIDDLTRSSSVRDLFGVPKRPSLNLKASPQTPGQAVTLFKRRRRTEEDPEEDDPVAALSSVLPSDPLFVAEVDECVGRAGS